MLAALDPLDDEAVDEPAGEPQLDPAAGDRRGVELLGDEVVEEPIQVRQARVDHDPRDGADQRRLLHGLGSACAGWGRLRDQSELLWSLLR